MNKEIIPIDDRILLKKRERDGVTSAGLIMPELSDMESGTAEVIAIGPGLRNPSNPSERIGTFIQVGDIVAIPKHGAFRLELEDETYYIMNERDIFAVVERKSK